MADIDGALSMAGYAAFALQQPLALATLTEAADRAELPLAAGAPAEVLLIDDDGPGRGQPLPPSPERIERLIEGAPELGGIDPMPRRRISDPDPLD